MESKKINQLATELAPDLSDLTIIGDPTTGISKKITLSQMASLFTGTVEEYANLAAFPLVGVADTIYIALDTNILYRWNTGTSAYVELSPNIVSSLVFNDANGFDGTINLVGSVATLTITTALTTGSVGFIGASGALLQDNANFFWDDTNNRLGLGTNAPTTALDVFGSGIIGRINGTSTNNAYLGFASAGTNKWSIGNVQSDHRFRIFSEANSAELVSVLQTGEFGIGIANPTTKFHIDGAASALIANLDANVSVAKSISFRSDNSNRINLEVSGTESGSNAGADLFIRRYSDAGALIDTPLTIVRSTGSIGIGTITPKTYSTLTNNGQLISLQNIGIDVGQSYRFNNYYNSGTGTDRTISTGFAAGIGLESGSMTFGLSTSSITADNNVSVIERLRITSGGNVGIGVTAPAENYFGVNRIFEIGGSTVPGIVLRSTLKTGEHSMITGGDGLILSSTGSANAANDNLIRFFTGPTNSSYSASERMRISSSGLVTVTGTGSAGNAEGIYFKRVSSLNQGGFISGSGGALVLTATNAESSLYGTTVLQRYDGSSFTESLRITSDGQLCVRTSAVVSPGGVSGVSNMVNPDNNGQWALALQNNATFTGYGRGIGIRNVTDYNTTSSEFIFCIGNATARFIVESNGGIHNYSANNVNLSDERVKKDIIKLESYWDKFKAIEIVKFKYKDQTHEDYNIGVIAQQVLEIAPEFVNEDGFGGENNIPEDGIPLKSIYTEDLHHATIKVLQEAMNKIEILESEVKILKAK
jgi:hypothetical protein